MKAIADFLRQNKYYVLAGALILIVGLFFMATQGIRRSRPVVIDAENVISSSFANEVSSTNEDSHSYYNEDMPQVVSDPLQTLPSNDIDTTQLSVNEDGSASQYNTMLPVEIIVHVVGEVYLPGMVAIYSDQRVGHAIAAAGGATAYADLTRINEAAFMRDAMQIIVPAVGDDITDVFIFDDAHAGVMPGVSTHVAQQLPQAPPQYDSGLININTATVAQLRTLPQIGEARANSIIAHRESTGGFQSVEELIHVHNIGVTILDGIRDLVTVGW